MRAFCIVLLVVLLAVFSVAKPTKPAPASIAKPAKPMKPTPEGVPLKLTAANYAKVTGDKSKVVLVKVFADWCAPCQEIRKAYNELAALYAKDKGVIIAELNGPQNEKFTQSLGVKGYPTLLLHSKGVVREYGGPRAKETLKHLIDLAKEVTIAQKSSS